MSTLLGGTLAEELALGEASDGCSNDLSRATQIARRMVVEFGMSSVLGRLNYLRDNQTGPGAQEQRWSEQTAREIDLEVRRIVDQAQERAHKILLDHRFALDRIAARLVDQETIDGADLDELLESADGKPRNTVQ